MAMAGSACTDGQNTMVEPRLMVSRATTVYLWAATRGMEGKTPASNLRAKNSQNLKLFVLHGCERFADSKSNLSHGLVVLIVLQFL